MNEPGLNKRAKRIGMFGGAFDPPHNAHLALAQIACESLELDALYVVPTGQAWHKARGLTASEHRLAMARLAFADLPDVVVDARETYRAGPTFTIETLRALQAENPGAQLYLVMGADQWAAFKQWHEWQAIVDIAILCVAARAQFNWDRARFDPQNERKINVVMLRMPSMAISATQIRQLLAGGLGENQATGDQIASSLPQSVARYIAEHQLYTAPSLY